jgi:membrane fusion protein, multidrug efflux system
VADATAAEYTAAVREVSAAQAQVAQKRADVDYAKLQLSYVTMTAPADGVISKKSVEVGQYVQAGQPLMAIVEDHEVWVVANFKETQLRRMRIGQPVAIHVDAYPQVTFHGRIESIAAATGAKFSLLPPDNATGNFVKVVQRIPVKVLFTDPPDTAHPLRVGMDVTATVDLG